jgi:arginine exporter protein ArgO
MNASHASNVGPTNLHPGGAPVHRPRTALVVLYAALVAQLAIWSIMAARVGLTAFTQAHRGAEAHVVVGGAIWLIFFTITVAAATIRYRRYDR